MSFSTKKLPPKNSAKRNKEKDGYLSVEQLYKRASYDSYSSAGGFLVESSDEEDSYDQERASCSTDQNFTGPNQEPNRRKQSSDGSHPQCLSCKETFPFSFLFESFGYSICDNCRTTDAKYKLITRTEAKSAYLLKDCDLDIREPILKFVKKKNPHNPRWGDMKLYLKIQIEARALDIWQSWENLEEAKSKRESTKTRLREKRFERTLKEMRSEIRGDVKRMKTHEHKFGDEQYDSETGAYKKKCEICSHCVSYEKM